MKKLLFTAAIVLLSATTTYGKKREPVVVGAYQFERVGQSVHATLTLSHAKNGRAGYKTIVEPILTNGVQSVEMPLVVFRTTKGRILDFRHRVVYPSSTILACNRHQVVYNYKFSYQKWMGDSQLLLEIASSGCGKVVKRPSVWVAQNVVFSPNTPCPTNPNDPSPKLVLMPVLKRESGSAFVEFPIGSAQLLGNFENNAIELAKINNSIESVLSDPENRSLQRVELWGTCSPDGSYAENAELAQSRVEAIRDYIIKSAPNVWPEVSVSWTPENWEGLVAALADNSWSWSRQVIAIALSKESSDQKKVRLQDLNGGATYDYLLAEIYPKLRRVDYLVEYLVRELVPSQVDQVNMATDALRQGRLSEVLPLLEQVTELNEYYYNTLGVYLLLTGDYAAARRALELSAAMGLPEAQENLRQLEVRMQSPTAAESQQ